MSRRDSEDSLTERQARILALVESEQIRDLVDSWPDPTPEQLRTLALLLAPPRSGDHDDEA